MAFFLKNNQSVTFMSPDKHTGVCIRRLDKEPINSKIVLLNNLLAFYITEQENKFHNSNNQTSLTEKIILPPYFKELMNQILTFIENNQQLYNLPSQTDQYLQAKNLAIKEFNKLLSQTPEILEEIQIK